MLVIATLAFAACHHDAAPPAEPAGTPPLPPASGTPIGFLIDDAGELKLTDDQVTKLRDLDTSLAGELEKIDAQTRAANRPADDPSATPPPSGGRRGGGRRGGMGGMGGSSGRHKRGGGGAGSGVSPTGGGASANRLADERSADVREALKRAFELLDATQRETAQKVLAAHDVDVEVGSTHAPTATPDDEADPPPEP